MHRLVAALSLIGLGLSSGPVGAGDVAWERQQLDAAFRSEGVAAADVNHDGKIDVLAGDVWYEAPDWTMHEIRTPGKHVAGVGYSTSFANWAYDINGDGWDDFILIGFPGDPFYWYENPQNKPDHWKQHLIWHSACNETPIFQDITGDGKPELILGSQPESQMGYLPVPAKEKAEMKWSFEPISVQGDPAKNGTFKYYHGLGAGDVNRDGRQDVVIPHGWWEQPSNLADAPWMFHPLVLGKDGKNPLPAANIHVDDLDLDGDQDMIMSSAHTYGVWWFENTESGFTYHLIDESYSQTHAMEFVDINGDGVKDIVTGKRFFAHNGGDPGGKDPVVMYWYEIKKTKGKPPEFIPHEIVAGKDTGVGTQFLVQDINDDKRPDIILSNKKGVNVLLQKKP
jgi:hypothetical protein